MRSQTTRRRWIAAFGPVAIIAALLCGSTSSARCGGTLSFEVDQGPAEPWTFGVGASYSAKPWLELSLDTGSHFHGGWYVAVVPVFRF